jgi:hypothetical protein
MTTTWTSSGPQFFVATTRAFRHAPDMISVRFDALGGPGGLSFRHALDLMTVNKEFQGLCSEVLIGAPFPAYFWECPPVTASSAATVPYEFVIINSVQLNKATQDSGPFRTHLQRALDSKQDMASFPSLGKDSWLVSPCPSVSRTDSTRQSTLTHLASFMRTAPLTQLESFWSTTALAMQQKLRERGSSPSWLSTSGLGVYHLHARIDSRPKYYQHVPFTVFP